MKTRFFLFVLVALSASGLQSTKGSPACSTQSATHMTCSDWKKQVRPLRNFSAISNEGAGDLYVTVGEAFKVEVEGTPDVLDRVITEVKNGTLVVRFKEKKGGWSWSSNNEMYKVRVFMPYLAAVANSGSADVAVQGNLRNDSFALSLSGSGDVKIQALRTNVAKFQIAGSGSIMVEEGKTQRFDVSIAGSGDVKTTNMNAEVATVQISGSGDVALTASRLLDVQIAGSGNVHYAGNPRITQNIQGSGDVVRTR